LGIRFFDICGDTGEVASATSTKLHLNFASVGCEAGLLGSALVTAAGAPPVAAQSGRNGPFCVDDGVTGNEATDKTATTLLTSKESLPSCLDDLLGALVSGAAEVGGEVAVAEGPVGVGSNPKGKKAKRAAKAAAVLAAANAAVPTPLSVIYRRVLQTLAIARWRSNASHTVQSQRGTRYGAQRFGDSTGVEDLAVGPGGGS
jgi:hypothetical protein